MELKKTTNDYGLFDITLIDETNRFQVIKQGQDYTFTCRPIKLEETYHLTFVISADYVELYQIFDKLYSSIVSGDIFGLGIENYNQCMDYHTYGDLVQDGTIKYNSDATRIECPNTLSINRYDEKIVLTFDKVDGKPFCEFKIPYEIQVHIRMSGGRYDPFCIPFKTLYEELQTLENIKRSSKQLSIDPKEEK